MGRMSEIAIEAEQYLKDSFDIDWDCFNDIARAASYEVYYGPLGTDYWDYAEKLDYYDWCGFNKAIEDLRELLERLPSVIYYNEDGSFSETCSATEECLEIPVIQTLLNYELARLI
jgi:hypothetical protein